MHFSSAMTTGAFALLNLAGTSTAWNVALYSTTDCSGPSYYEVGDNAGVGLDCTNIESQENLFSVNVTEVSGAVSLFGSAGCSNAECGLTMPDNGCGTFGTIGAETCTNVPFASISVAA
ncbi:MAG: hypothetical protein M1819_002491 [Sarea resinae]|nr:MAG: hypothetical protein M1819_002491 [Sarea resinae]